MAISQLLLAAASSNLVDRKSKCYFIIKLSLLLYIRLCWREISPGVGGTLNVEVIGMLVGNFFWRTLKYPDFDFKPLKIPKLQLGGLFWGKWLPFSKNFPKDPKNYQNQNFIPISIPITLLWKWPPREIRPDARKTTENEFVASFLWNDYPEKRILTKLLCCW